jgi:hypothetical protein
VIQTSTKEKLRQNPENPIILKILIYLRKKSYKKYKTMIKIIGFVAVIATVMLLLRPSLIFTPTATPAKTESNTTENTINTVLNRNATAVSNTVADATPSPESATANPTTLSTAKKAEKTTEYAEGYDAKSFGKAFDDPMEGVTTAEIQAEPQGIWRTLLKLTFDVKFDERVDDIVFAPIFTPEIRKLAGKEIEIQGYILPHDITKMGGGKGNDGSMFIFSAFPAATCFYCGGAGPESVIEVYPAAGIPFSKQMVTLKGKLELNDTDFLQLAYKLKQARIVN